jgi:hypothetical protein
MTGRRKVVSARERSVDHRPFSLSLASC